MTLEFREVDEQIKSNLTHLDSKMDEYRNLKNDNERPVLL